jgi:hypothetical protein
VESRFREEFATATAALRPLFNRLVFYGVETCRGELDPDASIRAPRLSPRVLHALTTSQLTRLSPELNAAGFKRTGRASVGERWESPQGLTLVIESSADAMGAEADAGILEYATLLTTSVKLDSGDTIRVSAVSAQLALMWRAHVRSGSDFSASAWTEEIVELVVCRRRIREDAAALPEEIRGVVARAVAEFEKSDSVLWTLEHALPEARTTPGLAAETLKRFRDLAGIAA